MASESTEESGGTGYRLTPPTGTAYERMRATSPTHFGGPLAGRIGRYAPALAAIAFVAGQQWLAATGPVDGGPVLAVAPGPAGVGGAILAATATLLVGCANYRRRREPMTEREALRVLVVEDAATYVGSATGVGVIVLAVALPTLGLGPSVAGAGPLTAGLAVGAALTALACHVAGRWLAGRVPGEET